jgi:hypothetical protein
MFAPAVPFAWPAELPIVLSGVSSHSSYPVVVRTVMHFVVRIVVALVAQSHHLVTELRNLPAKLPQCFDQFFRRGPVSETSRPVRPAVPRHAEAAAVRPFVRPPLKSTASPSPSSITPIAARPAAVGPIVVRPIAPGPAWTAVVEVPVRSVITKHSAPAPVAAPREIGRTAPRAAPPAVSAVPTLVKPRAIAMPAEKPGTVMAVMVEMPVMMVATPVFVTPRSRPVSIVIIVIIIVIVVPFFLAPMASHRRSRMGSVPIVAAIEPMSMIAVLPIVAIPIVAIPIVIVTIVIAIIGRRELVAMFIERKQKAAG